MINIEKDEKEVSTEVANDKEIKELRKHQLKKGRKIMLFREDEPPEVILITCSVNFNISFHSIPSLKFKSEKFLSSSHFM